MTSTAPQHILIVGSGEDPHAAAVKDAVSGQAHAILVDAASLECSDVTVTPTSVVLRCEQCGLVELGGGVRAWLRRVAPAAWDAQVVIGSTAAAVKASWLALLSAVLRLPGLLWLGPPTAVELAENKLLQYGAAARLSIPVPKTVVTTSADTAHHVLGDSFVLKPLGPGQVFDGTDARTVFATEVRWDDPAMQDMAGAPFLAQEGVKATRHLRIVTAAARGWAGELRVDSEAPLDWRRSAESHRAFQGVSEPHLGQQALRLAAALGVGYSSQDWVEVADGSHYFLDLNPGGQWLFLPFASEVTDAISGWLLGANA